MSPGRLVGPVLLLLSALLLHLLLIQPNHPGAMTWQALFLFPLELPAILLALIAASGRVAFVLRLAVTVLLCLLAVLKAADFAFFTALGRGFNPVADIVLVGAGFRLLSGAIGLVPAILAAVGAVIATALVVRATWWATGVWARVQPPMLARGAAGVAAIAAAGVAVGEIGQTMGRWRLPVDPPGAAFTARVAVERVGLARRTLAELRDFRIAALRDPMAERDDLFDLIDRDVLLVFVESYGRASLDTDLYAATHRQTLRDGARRLEAAGLAMASGFVSAPTQGGQSWLSHATFANGLWVNGQTKYSAVLASGRETLFHLAARSGFHTAAVMPQITLDWPESAVMGFDTVLAAADLGYEGPAFNWVTMPDQFTFAALDRLVRDPIDQPVFAQLATGSSHAPWVPVPELVEWDAIGDGRIFQSMVEGAPTPEEVWRDRDRVREQYRRAVDYALSNVIDYAARHADDPPLMIVTGDHQAADFVALDDRSDVPVHVIGPPELVAQVRDWGWRPGLVPAPDTPVIGMDRMRDRLIGAFTSGLAAIPLGG